MSSPPPPPYYIWFARGEVGKAQASKPLPTSCLLWQKRATVGSTSSKDFASNDTQH